MQLVWRHGEGQPRELFDGCSSSLNAPLCRSPVHAAQTAPSAWLRLVAQVSRLWAVGGGGETALISAGTAMLAMCNADYWPL